MTQLFIDNITHTLFWVLATRPSNESLALGVIWSAGLGKM